MRPQSIFRRVSFQRSVHTLDIVAREQSLAVFITKNLGIADVTLSNPSIWSIIANKDTVFHSFLESQTLRQASIVPTSTTEFLVSEG